MTQSVYSGGIVLLLCMIALSDVSFQDFTCPENCQCDEILLGTNCSNTLDINQSIYYNVSHLSTVLLLEKNRIENATSIVPWTKLKNLRKISLASNFIQTFETGTVSVARKLIYLDLSRNIFSSIPFEIKKLSRLKYLDLSNNLIKAIQPDNFDHLVSLQTLRIDSNGIHTVRPNTFMFCNNLESLSLSESNFSESASCVNVNTWFGNNRTQTLALRELDLSQSSILCMEDTAFLSVENLEKLSLSNNYLQMVQPSLISKLTKLKHLNFENNFLTEIPWGFFKGIDRLVDLNLASNSISSAQNIFVKSLRKIEVLNLGDNNISIPSPLNFRRFKYLRELYLQRNHITIFPLVQNLRNLEVLDLSRNYIKVVSTDALHRCDALTKVLLNNNRMESFRPKAEPLNSIEEFRIDNNRLECDCHLFEFYRNSEDKDWVLTMLQRTYCYEKPFNALDSVSIYYTEMICHHVTPPNVARILVGTWLSLVAVIACFVWIKTICSAKRKQNAWSSDEFKRRQKAKNRTMRGVGQKDAPQHNSESTPVWEKETLLQTCSDSGDHCQHDMETKLSEAPWKSMTETFV